MFANSTFPIFVFYCHYFLIFFIFFFFFEYELRCFFFVRSLDAIVVISTNLITHLYTIKTIHEKWASKWSRHFWRARDRQREKIQTGYIYIQLACFFLSFFLWRIAAFRQIWKWLFGHFYKMFTDANGTKISVNFYMFLFSFHFFMILHYISFSHSISRLFYL